MERFDMRGMDWRLVPRQDGLGAFCWAEDALWYQQQYRLVLVLYVATVLVCVILAGYLVYHKHDPVPVERASISEERYEQAVAESRRLQGEVELSRKKITDLKAQAAHFAAQVKTQNTVLRQREKQLQELRVSVPSQPIILEALRKEAATDAGFMQAVRRNFGPIKVEVR